MLSFDSPAPSTPRAAALPKRRLDQRVEHPARDGLDVAIACPPGVAQHHVWLDTVHERQGFQQAIVGLWSQGGPQGRRRPVQHVATMTTAEWFLLQPAETLAGYIFVAYLLRAPFGVALQGIRDNPRRMSALGFDVTAHRVTAYAIAGLIAAVGCVLLVWYNGLVSPASVGVSWLIHILIIAVLGGLRHSIGPFLGALVFVLMQNFAVDLVDRERFNLLIGGVFLLIVLFLARRPPRLVGARPRLPHRPLDPIAAVRAGDTTRPRIRVRQPR